MDTNETTPTNHPEPVLDPSELCRIWNYLRGRNTAITVKVSNQPGTWHLYTSEDLDYGFRFEVIRVGHDLVLPAELGLDGVFRTI